MHQILRGTSQQAELEIYWNNQLINADGDVLVTVVDADYPDTIILCTNQVAYNDPDVGKYTFELDPSFTQLNRVLEVQWSYQVNNQTTQQQDFYEIYTPYASISDIIEYYNFGVRESDLNYRDPKEIAAAEFIARMQIENYTTQTFGRGYGDQEVWGNGSDALELTERMLTVDKVYENGQLVIDYTVNPILNTFGWQVELTPTYKAIRIINSDYEGIISYDNVVDPTVDLYGRFRPAYRYRVYGEKGWKYVPQDVRRCTVILAGDYLSQDGMWRQKYLSKVNLSEISFQLDKGAFNGTGNAIVDQILDQYRNVGIVII
jgi:hypothetical protein